MTHRYAEFVIRGNWYLGNPERFLLQAYPEGPAFMRLQGEEQFSVNPELPIDRLEALAQIEQWGWDVVSTHWGEDYMLILARRPIYGTKEEEVKEQ